MAQLCLEDGTRIEGEPFGALTDVEGEVVFTTNMTGYCESLTDPSFRGQILVFTYPLIGNYGVPSEELNEWGFSQNFESETVQVRGVIVAQLSDSYSHHAAVSSLDNWLKRHGVPGITGVDTRMLTKKLREEGVTGGRMMQKEDVADDLKAESRKPKAETQSKYEIRNTKYEVLYPRGHLVSQVSCTVPITYEPTVTSNPSPSPNQRPEPFTILAYDCGMKRGILRSFLKRGVRVVRVPWDFALDAYRGPLDGIFMSNGPGDPKDCKPTITAIQRAIERNIPTFGICLGNQLMALAVGGDTFKMKYGHRGANQPCVELLCKDGSVCERGKQRCIITSQNHGYAVSDTLPAEWDVWFRNANDGTVEGIRHTSGRFFAVQFHPEASPGPEDAGYLFEEFLGVLERERTGVVAVAGVS